MPRANIGMHSAASSKMPTQRRNNHTIAQGARLFQERDPRDQSWVSIHCTSGSLVLPDEVRSGCAPFDES